MTTTARPELPCASSASIDPMDVQTFRRHGRNWEMPDKRELPYYCVGGDGREAWERGECEILSWRTTEAVVPKLALPCPSSAAIPMRAGIEFRCGDIQWRIDGFGRRGRVLRCVDSGGSSLWKIGDTTGGDEDDTGFEHNWQHGYYTVLPIPPEPQTAAGGADTPSALIPSAYRSPPKPRPTAAQLCDRIPFNARCSTACYVAGRHVEAKAKAAWKTPRQDAVKREEFGNDGHTIYSAGAGHVGKFNKVAHLETPRHFFGVEETDPMRRPRWPTARYERPGRWTR